MELERKEVFPMIEEDEEDEEGMDKTVSTVKKSDRKIPDYSKI